MMSKLTFQREIEIRHDVDVLVVGGGPAGVAAAVTAARQGAKGLFSRRGCLPGRRRHNCPGACFYAVYRW
jgi:flavin-dependent dehydrogenase